MIVLYFILIFLLGYIVSYVFNKLKIVNYKNFNFLEIFSFSFIYGIILYVLYLIGLNYFKINFNFYMFIPIFIVDFISIILLISDFKKKRIIFEFAKQKGNKRLNIFLDILLVILFIIMFVTAYSSFLNAPDEFSLWGDEAKKIFVLKGYNQLNASTGISYPLTMPLLYSGYYFLTGFISTNSIRVISVLITMVFFINMLGRCYRKNQETSLYKILFLIFISTCSIAKYLVATLYVDMLIIILTSVGFLYLLDYIFDGKNKDNMIIFIIYSALNVIVKPDGIFVSLISLCVVFLFLIINKIFKVKNINFEKKDFKYLGLDVLVISGFYLIYRFIYSMLASNAVNYVVKTAGEKELRLDYLNTTLDNGALSLFKETPYIIFISLFILLLFYNFYKNKCIKNINKIVFLLVFIFGNYVFLNVAYIYHFGGEGLLAPSIIRYMTRVIPIVFEIILILYYNAKTDK